MGQLVSNRQNRIGRTDLKHLIDPKQRVYPDQSISIYRELMDTRLGDGTLTPQDFSKICGLRFRCFYKPAPCHADLMEEYANWFHDSPRQPPVHHHKNDHASKIVLTSAGTHRIQQKADHHNQTGMTMPWNG